MSVGGVGKRADNFSVCEIWVNTLSLFHFERFQGPPDVVFLLCSIRKMFICYGFGTCANDTFGSKFQAWAGLEVVCGPETLSVGQRSLGFTFVHHCTAAWEEAGLGWIPQRWVTFMFYVIRIFKKMPLGLDQCHLPWKKPWKTCCGSAGEDHAGYCRYVKILLMWRQEGELSWESCSSFQLRNLVNKALNNCTSEKEKMRNFMKRKTKFVCMRRNTFCFTETEVWAVWHIVWSPVRRD